MFTIKHLRERADTKFSALGDEARAAIHSFIDSLEHDIARLLGAADELEGHGFHIVPTAAIGPVGADVTVGDHPEGTVLPTDSPVVAEGLGILDAAYGALKAGDAVQLDDAGNVSTSESTSAPTEDQSSSSNSAATAQSSATNPSSEANSDDSAASDSSNSPL